MFISDKLKIISVLFVFVVTFGTGFLTGQKVSGDYYRNEIKQIEIKSLQLENEYLIKKISLVIGEIFFNYLVKYL